MIDLVVFFRYLKGHYHGNQFCEKKLQTPLMAGYVSGVKMSKFVFWYLWAKTSFQAC